MSNKKRRDRQIEMDRIKCATTGGPQATDEEDREMAAMRRA